jgi:hypothetical protein
MKTQYDVKLLMPVMSPRTYDVLQAAPLPRNSIVHLICAAECYAIHTLYGLSTPHILVWNSGFVAQSFYLFYTIYQHASMIPFYFGG